MSTTDQIRPLAYTTRDAAKLLGISPAHLRSLVKRGDLPHARASRRILIPAAAIEKFLSGKRS